MRRIGITPEKLVFRERERITNLVQSGYVDYFHIRKPSFSLQEMEKYLSFFPYDIRQKLSLHDFHSLCLKMEIGGVHLNKRNPEFKPEYKNKRISVSCHSIKEVEFWKNKSDYVFLSPIFDSISKKGYKSAFSFRELKKCFDNKVFDNNVVALGGVTIRNISTLEQIGFSSCALLSELWQLPKTMFISPNKDEKGIIEDCKTALQYGIKFIQLRMKQQTNEQVLKVAEILRPLCDKYYALFTIDDRIELLNTNLFDGVHLGKNDMPIKQAKNLISNKYLLGATCNTFQEVERAINDGADYLGVGPYKFTTTKQNLSPILGLEGYKNIISSLQTSYPCSNNIPIYAIGAIGLEDLTNLQKVGVYGVALSSAITSSSTPQKTITEILKHYL